MDIFAVDVHKSQYAPSMGIPFRFFLNSTVGIGLLDYWSIPFDHSWHNSGQTTVDIFYIIYVHILGIALE